MKKLFFLCAAAALFAACSSDEVGEMSGVTENVTATETYASSGSVEFANGVTMSVGALDEEGAPMARANGKNVKFSVDLSCVDDVLKGFGEYKLKADDFAIRVDGVYQDITVNNNKVNALDIVLREQNLKVVVKNLEELDFAAAKDYTFETYLWIENKQLLNDGTGGYGELFTAEDKAAWIGAEAWPAAETGMDLSEAIWNADGASFSKNSPAAGLLVKYNVYRGLSGQDGDTPYIKVSIHVEKPEPTTVGDGANECDWVHIPYVAE